MSEEASEEEASEEEASEEEASEEEASEEEASEEEAFALTVAFAVEVIVELFMCCFGEEIELVQKQFNFYFKHSFLK